MSSQAKNSGAHNLSSGLSYFKTQIEGVRLSLPGKSFIELSCQRSGWNDCLFFAAFQALVQARNDLRDLDRRIMEIKQTDKSLSDLPKKIKHSIMVQTTKRIEEKLEDWLDSEFSFESAWLGYGWSNCCKLADNSAAIQLIDYLDLVNLLGSFLLVRFPLEVQRFSLGSWFTQMRFWLTWAVGFW